MPLRTVSRRSLVTGDSHLHSKLYEHEVLIELESKCYNYCTADERCSAVCVICFRGEVGRRWGFGDSTSSGSPQHKPWFIMAAWPLTHHSMDLVQQHRRSQEGCSGCTCTPRAVKIFFQAQFTGKMCKCTPAGHEVHPQAEQESIFAGWLRFGGIFRQRRLKKGRPTFLAKKCTPAERILATPMSSSDVAWLRQFISIL